METITEENLLNRKVIFVITQDQPRKEVDEMMKDIFVKSFKLGISWNIENHDGFIMFCKTNI